MEKDYEKFVNLAMECNFFEEVKKNPTEAFNLLAKMFYPKNNKVEFDCTQTDLSK